MVFFVASPELELELESDFDREESDSNHFSNHSQTCPNLAFTDRTNKESNQRFSGIEEL